jgi:hypothetical protein
MNQIDDIVNTNHNSLVLVIKNLMNLNLLGDSKKNRAIYL